MRITIQARDFASSISAWVIGGHEVLAAARDDERLGLIGTELDCDLDHRLLG